MAIKNTQQNPTPKNLFAENEHLIILLNKDFKTILQNIFSLQEFNFAA